LLVVWTQADSSPSLGYQKEEAVVLAKTRVVQVVMQSGVVALAQPWKAGRNMKDGNMRVLRRSTQAVEAGHTMVGRKSVRQATGGLATTSYPREVRTQSKKKKPIDCIRFVLGTEYTHSGHTPALQEVSTVGLVPERYVAKLGATPGL